MKKLFALALVFALALALAACNGGGGKIPPLREGTSSGGATGTSAPGFETLPPPTLPPQTSEAPTQAPATNAATNAPGILSVEALQGMWRCEGEESVEFLSIYDSNTFNVTIFYRGSGGQILEQRGQYRIEGGKIAIYNMEDDQGKQYDDMTVSCGIVGDVMTLSGEQYWHVAEEDMSYVMNDPFAPYPVGLGGP